MANQAEYRTIKSLVVAFVHSNRGSVEYDALTQEVRKYFPASKWQRTHWAWYKNQILHGRLKDLFSDDERAALSKSKGPDVAIVATAPASSDPSRDLARRPQAKNPEVKRIGDSILNHIRLVISLAAGQNVDKRFKLNRWVFSRLLQDEIRVKRPVKKMLWEQGMRSCQACKAAFASLKGVEIHRKDESQGYSAGNCELLCRDCHQELG